MFSRRGAITDLWKSIERPNQTQKKKKQKQAIAYCM